MGSEESTPIPTHYSDFHGFLINCSGELNEAASVLGEVREYINDLPKTASTFRLSALPLPKYGRITRHHLELCKAWPFVSDYGPTGDHRRYVNPNSDHAYQFSDLIVECACGARFVKNYEVENSPIQQESEHTDSCMPFHRLEARAEMSRKRYKLIRRLGWLGWKGPDIAPRMGVTQNHTGGYTRDYGIDLRENFVQYRRAVGRTSAYLILREQATLSGMAEVYGHSTKSIREWAKKHSPYTAKSGPKRDQLWDDVDMTHPPHVDSSGVDTGSFVWNPQDRVYVDTRKD